MLHPKPSAILKRAMTKADIFLLGLNHPYQWRVGSAPSQLEIDERHRFIRRVHDIVQSFRPNIIADETPDTDNPDLLGLLPSAPIPIDVPDGRKAQRGFSITRSIHYVCPFVDSVRERYWRNRLHQLVRTHPQPRVLMFVGALHLESCFGRSSFADLLMNAGYNVVCANLWREAGWDHSWVREWQHPVTPTTGSPATLRCCVATGTYQRNQRCDHKIYWKELLASRCAEVA